MKATPYIGRSSIPRHKILGSLSLRAFARRVGVTPSSLSLILSGKRLPRLGTAGNLARVGRMSIDDLYKLLMVGMEGRGVQAAGRSRIPIASRRSGQKKGAR